MEGPRQEGLCLQGCCPGTSLGLRQDSEQGEPEGDSRGEVSTLREAMAFRMGQPAQGTSQGGARGTSTMFLLSSFSF